MATTFAHPSILRRSGFWLAIAIAAGPTTALASSCGLCATKVTTNTSLAGCFLERYDSYAAKEGMAVAIDLEDCPADRGVVEALSSPTAASVVPDTRFLLTHAQLACLKLRLEAPGALLDPYVTIALDDCE